MNNSAPLLIFLFLCTGVFVWWFFVRKKPKSNDGDLDDKGITYTRSVSDIPANFDANKIARGLHDAMLAMGSWTKQAIRGLAFLAPPFGLANEFGSDGAALNNAWQYLYNQNNAQVKVIFYTYNAHYDKEEKGTLTKWIENTNAPLASKVIQKKLLAKLRSLKLY